MKTRRSKRKKTRSSASTSTGAEYTSKKRISGWMVAIAVPFTGGVTALIMMQTASGSRWTGGANAPVVSSNGSPIGPPALGASAPAATGPASVVVGTVAQHGDFGVCTACHTMVSAGGGSVPVISALSPMPHDYLGVCGNCHRFSSTTPPAAPAAPALLPGDSPNGRPPGQATPIFPAPLQPNGARQPAPGANPTQF